MIKSDLENIKSQIEDKIKKEDFQGLICYLTREEQMVLLVLIRSNSALPIRTIRNYLIEILKNIYLNQIFNKYNFYNPAKDIVEVPKKHEIYYMQKEKTFIFERWKKVPYYITEYPEEVQKKIISEKVKEKQIKFLFDLKEKAKTDKKFEFLSKLYESFIDDDILIKYNIRPQSYSNKVKLWEKALKDLVNTPSWNIIKNSIISLVNLDMVKERKIEGKKTETFYFVSPLIYDIWKKSKEKIHKLVEEKKYKPDENEEYWFF